jgi:hypothetical protein
VCVPQLLWASGSSPAPLQPQEAQPCPPILSLSFLVYKMEAILPSPVHVWGVPNRALGDAARPRVRWWLAGLRPPMVWTPLHRLSKSCPRWPGAPGLRPSSHLGLPRAGTAGAASAPSSTIAFADVYLAVSLVPPLPSSGANPVCDSMSPSSSQGWVQGPGRESGQGHTYPTHLSGAKEDGGPCPVQGQLSSVETQGNHGLFCETS